MRKEVFLAILAGITIGLVFAFGVWKVSRKVKSKPISVATQVTPTPKNVNSFVVSNLSNFDVITQNPFKLSGFAEPGIDIVVSTLNEDYFTKSLEDGSFETEVDLPAGLSQIKVTLPAQNTNLMFTVVYSTEASENATSYVGSITDISAGTIQLKGANGEILQASTNGETTYTNLLKKITEVKESDLAIGDYVAVLGTVNGNKVLHAERVLITSPITEVKTEVKEITIETLSKTKINDITLPKTWKGPNVSNLEEGQKIIVVGIVNGETYTLRSIFATLE